MTGVAEGAEAESSGQKVVGVNLSVAKTTFAPTTFAIIAEVIFVPRMVIVMEVCGTGDGAVLADGADGAFVGLISALRADNQLCHVVLLPSAVVLTVIPQIASMSID